MLVLTRRIGEAIVIGNDIRITVVNVGPGRVKIGIQAPDNVRVDREEVHARIVEEKTGEAPAEPETVRTETPILVGDDAPRIYNRIADKLPPEESTPPASSRLDPFRRKPR